MLGRAKSSPWEHTMWALAPADQARRDRCGLAPTGPPWYKSGP